jgi:hypothetical protein
MDEKRGSDLDLETLLNVQQALRAMYFFLREEFRRTGSDDLGSILGDIQPATDGYPLDMASWSDWLRAVKEALSESP